MFEVLHYIHENISKPLHSAETAKLFGYSKWHFCDKFRIYTGKTFTEYVRQLRIRLAALEILEGKSVLEVATSYGYETAGGFGKAFLTEYGCLPREYRKKTKESQLHHERRKLDMFQISDRCAMLKDEVMFQHIYMNQFTYQRNIYYELGLAETIGKELSNDEICATALARVLTSFHPIIAPGELIVGNHYGDNEYALPPHSPEGRALLRESHISPADIDAYFVNYDRPIAQYLNRAPRIGFTPLEVTSHNEWMCRINFGNNDHTLISYETIIRHGFEGMLLKIGDLRQEKGDCPLYRACEIICRAAITMGERYVREAQRLLALCDPNYQSEDLEAIIRTCSTVPRKGATTFAQAIQALLFAHTINTWEDFINANSLGRLDQILYPYYRADIDSGLITREYAFELLCCLWIKLYRPYDVQQSCIGGCDSEGNNAVNELSYMMLDITEQLNLVRCLSVRFSKNTDRAFLRRALEVVGHMQKGVPFFFNDDVLIPSLEAYGISTVDARDYTQLGCVETVIPGKSNPHAVSGILNLLKALELTLNNGVSMIHPDMRIGLPTEPLQRFTTFRSFYQAVLKQITHQIRSTCHMVVKALQISEIESARPFKSLLVDGCLESGRDYNQHGARYDYYQICLGGVPNLADSLMVIKKFVYEEKIYTLKELKTILDEDFPDEAVRQEFIQRAPKYGNGIEEVDKLAADLVNHACDVFEQVSKELHISFHPQIFTYTWMTDQGKNSAASPDGRRKGEAIASSCSPMAGRDFGGLTALLHSACTLPTKRIPGTTAVIAEVDPKIFTDSNLDTLTDILIEAGAKGLSNLQFNTIDAETLKDAIEHPERHPNLAVRVEGYSQDFHSLPRHLQDHIISRTKHNRL